MLRKLLHLKNGTGSRSLSLRLLSLTALWVTFIVASIGYSMWLSWSREDTSRTLNLVTDMRAQVYRTNLMTDNRFYSEEFLHQVRLFSRSLDTLKGIGSMDPILSRREKAVTDQIAAIERDWTYILRPLLQTARKNSVPLDTGTIEIFVDELTHLEEILSGQLATMSLWLRYIQILLITLAVGSLFVIMWLLVRWVIRPTDTLGAGLRELTEGGLKTRLSLTGSQEFERISDDFNRMADYLQELVEDLEGKVREKTAAYEEKNRDLSELYELTSYLSQPHPIEEMCEGFAVRLVQFSESRAGAVFLINPRRGKLEFAAGSELPENLFSRFTHSSIPLADLAPAMDSAEPVMIGSDAPESLKKYFCTGDFPFAWFFHIRNAGKGIGAFLLWEREPPGEASRGVQLFESCGSHLGIAIDNLRLIARERQYAVVEERNLMARGLHDSIAQTLSFLNLQVQILEHGLRDGDQGLVDETVSQIKEGVQESYDDVRELLLNFRERIHKESFVEAVTTVVERFEAQAQLKAELSFSEDSIELSGSRKLQAIFIMQEALANVRKHAQASRVRINVINGEDFAIEIIDNGRGIDPAIVAQRKGRHVGLNIMRERADKIGASVTVGPAPESFSATGTMVRLVIPGERREIQ